MNSINFSMKRKRLNSNIRCIEMNYNYGMDASANGLNSNIRCIEMQKTPRIFTTSSG